MPADVSIKQPNKGLAGGWDKSEGNARRHKDEATARTTTPDDDATSYTNTYTTSNFVYRDDVSKDEQGLNVRPCSQTLTSRFNKPFGSKAKHCYAISRFDVITAIQIV